MKNKKRKITKITLKLSDDTVAKCITQSQNVPPPPADTDQNPVLDDLGERQGDYDYLNMMGCEDSEAFFTETHEDQGETMIDNSNDKHIMWN